MTGTVTPAKASTIHASTFLVLAILLLNYSCFKGSKLVVSLFALELGASNAAIGTLFAMYAVFPIFLAVYAGKVGDRIGFRLPILLGSIGVAVGMLVPWLVPSFAGLVACCIVFGACFIFFSVSIQAATGLLPGDRARNYAIASLGNAAASFIGPVATGYSIDAHGHATTYLFVAMLPAAAVLCLLLGWNLVPQGRPRAKKEAADGTVAMLREHPDLRRILLAGAATESAIELHSFYMPIYGHSLGLPAFQIGVLIGLFAVGTVVVRVLLAWMLSQRGEEALMHIAMVIAAAVYCAFPFTRDTAYLGLLSFVLGLSLGCCNPLGQSIIHARAPSGRSGESMGIRQLINKTTGFAAPLLYGAFGTIVGMGARVLGIVRVAARRQRAGRGTVEVWVADQAGRGSFARAAREEAAHVNASGCGETGRAGSERLGMNLA